MLAGWAGVGGGTCRTSGGREGVGWGPRGAGAPVVEVEEVSGAPEVSVPGCTGGCAPLRAGVPGICLLGCTRCACFCFWPWVTGHFLLVTALSSRGCQSRLWPGTWRIWTGSCSPELTGSLMTDSPLAQMALLVDESKEFCPSQVGSPWVRSGRRGAGSEQSWLRRREPGGDCRVLVGGEGPPGWRGGVFSRGQRPRGRVALPGLLVPWADAQRLGQAGPACRPCSGIGSGPGPPAPC